MAVLSRQHEYPRREDVGRLPADRQQGADFQCADRQRPCRPGKTGRSPVQCGTGRLADSEGDEPQTSAAPFRSGIRSSNAAMSRM
jgi:hypothetical protein